MLTKRKIGDFVRIKHGFPFLGEHFTNEGKYIVLTPGNFFEAGGFKHTPGKEKYYDADFPEEYLCSEGDLIVAMTQQAEGLLGSTAIVPESGTFLHNQRIGLISWNETLSEKMYIYYLFMTDLVRQQIRRTASGSKVKHTSPERIYDVAVWIPDDIKIQKRISRTLENIDHKVSLNKAIIAELENTAKLLYDYWFTQFEFPDENGKPYRSSGGAMEYNAQLKREIPKGWTHGALSDIAYIIMGQSPKGISYNTEGDGMIFFQGCTDFGHRFPTSRVYTNKPSRIAEQGDILLSVRAPVGKTNIAYEKCCVGRGLSALRSKIGANAYLNQVIQGVSERLNTMSGNGTTFGAVTKEMLYELPVCKPEVSVIKAYEDKVAPMDRLIFKYEMQTRELTALRDFLLPLLMNGQVTVATAESVEEQLTLNR
ncbi:restriction endonuclease subunit S [Brevibacillus ginsengisoli]|uniref:restriction endonuclease subunit S n=1 Tax=Brevibacillus ginsengisoli TaxID=363854 RepID=UPI003CF78E75